MIALKRLWCRYVARKHKWSKPFAAPEFGEPYDASAGYPHKRCKVCKEIRAIKRRPRKAKV